MGLKLFASNVEPPLCKGRTFATLRASGKIPVSNDTLMIWQRGITNKSAASLIILRGILAGPVPLLGKRLINFRTSSVET